MTSTLPDFTSTIESLNALGEQINDILSYGAELNLPADYQNFNKIIVSGMGGSNLGARILSSVFADKLTCPIIINADYEAPACTDEHSLFILSSYSGTTEETLSSYNYAKAKGAKFIVITSQNDHNPLLDLATANNLPVLAFTPKYNPSNQPRLAIGYTCFALATILRKLNILNISDEELNIAILKLKDWGTFLANDAIDNDAKKITTAVTGKQLVLISGDFLTGNMHALRNQINENAKNFASYLTLPDLNHHAMEGLAKPDTNKENIIFVFFDSHLYSERVQLRSKLTKQIVAKNNLSFVDIKLMGDNKLEQSLEVLQLGAWITFYLALANQVNPLEIPWVDWFKKELK